MEKLSWTDRVRNEEDYLESRRGGISCYNKRRGSNRIGRLLCGHCLLQDVIEGKIEGRIEVKGRRGRLRN
jgi:hypothetical protein